MAVPKHSQITMILGLAVLAGCQFEDDSTSDGSNSSDQDGSAHTQVLNGCDVEAYQAEMLELVNEARATARDCGSTRYPATHALQYQCDLDEAAEGHSMDMADNNFFNHTGSDGLGVGERVTDSGYEWSAVGENIAAGQTTVEQVVQGWLDSPGHCENIMSDLFEEFGTSRVDTDSADYDTYWTQVFATPW